MSKPSNQLISLDNDQFNFLTKSEYIDELIDRLSQIKPSDRFLLVTHTRSVNVSAVAKLIENLIGAARRCVSVKFILDERAFPILQSLPLNNNQRKIAKHTHDA